MTTQQKEIKKLANTLLEDSAYYRKFTDDDLVNATIIFSNVMFDVIYTGNMEMKEQEILKFVFKIGDDLRKLIKEATGLDMHNLVKNTK